MNNYDIQARKDFKDSKKSVVFWICASSYNYYLHPENPPLLSDECFDKMCSWLLSNYDDTHHSKLSHLINKDRLRAGSLFDVLEHEYPLWLVRMVNNMTMKLTGETNELKI